MGGRSLAPHVDSDLLFVSHYATVLMLVESNDMRERAPITLSNVTATWFNA
jgi:hypothetical protein